MQVLSIIDTVV